MSFEIPKEINPGKVQEVILGADKSNGGTRSNIIKIGGRSSLQFHFFEGEIPNRPVIAMEVFDRPPAKYPNSLLNYFNNVINNPAEMAQKCVKEYGAEMISIRLESTHPEKGNLSADEAAEIVKSVVKSVEVPLIITGHNHFEKNNEVMKRVCEITAGENCLVNFVETNNYKTIAAACIAYGHTLVAQTPIDVNMAKQLNILLSDMSFPSEKIVIDPLTGALGYGFEYTYSIMERITNEALAGDKMLAFPMLITTGYEVSRIKESRALESEYPIWGDAELRAAYWEISTTMSLLSAGGDLAIMYNPKAVEIVKNNINEIFNLKNGDK